LHLHITTTQIIIPTRGLQLEYPIMHYIHLDRIIYLHPKPTHTETMGHSNATQTERHPVQVTRQVSIRHFHKERFLKSQLEQAVGEKTITVSIHTCNHINHRDMKTWMFHIDLLYQ